MSPLVIYSPKGGIFVSIGEAAIVISKITAVIHVLIKYMVIAALMPLRLFPVVKSRILLLSDLNGKFAGNPKYICEYLATSGGGKYQLYFAFSSAEAIPDSFSLATPVIIGSLKYFFTAMTSKVFITNSGGYSYIPFRKSQYIINTWHGGGAYKKVLLDYYGVNKTSLRNARLLSKRTSLLISSCTAFTDAFERAMLIDRSKIFESGMPRNDIMFRDNSELKETIKKKLGVSADTKLVLYAPTYRQPNKDVFTGAKAAAYDLDTEAVLSALHGRFGGEWKFAFRYHPKIRERGTALPPGVIDVSSYDDMQELLIASDVLINDYSSTMWDFALTGKPCFIFAEDLAEYENSYDFYTPISLWPFPMAENNDDLCGLIADFDPEKYQKAVGEHYSLLGSFEKGNACKLVCDKIEEVISL